MKWFQFEYYTCVVIASCAHALCVVVSGEVACTDLVSSFNGDVRTTSVVQRVCINKFVHMLLCSGAFAPRVFAPLTKFG